MEIAMDYTCIKCSLNDSDFPESRREIRPNQAISLAAPRGTIVRGESGTLWLTQQGHWQDYILVPGAQYLSPEDRKIVVSSLGGGGTITVSRLQPGAEHRFRGSPLRIDPAVAARLEREARSAPARFLGEWIARLYDSTVKAARVFFSQHGDPALKHK
jgi:hypothetical protein